jgi:nucleoside 2-deoxyribosyltransferase
MTTPPRAQIYVAGPGGFDAAGRAWHRRVCERLTTAGLDVLDPWVASEPEFRAAFAAPPGSERLQALRVANRGAGAKNAAMIRAADAVFALLDGVDVDSGTAAEIGFAAALGTLVVGYRTDWRTTGDNEAAIINLQLEYFIQSSGGVIITGDASTDDDALLEAAVTQLRASLTRR